MGKENKTWYYETKCRRCEKLNRWILTPNNEAGKEAEKRVNEHKVYSDEYPFDIRHCEHCDMDTRQERVAWLAS